MDAIMWIQRMADVNMAPDGRFHASVLNACAREGDCEAVHWCLKQMELMGVTPDVVTCNRILDTYAKAGNMAEMSRWTDLMDKVGIPVDIVICNILLNGCAKAKDTECAKTIFQQMRSKGIEPDNITYASFAKSFAPWGKWPDVELLLDNMIDEGIQMDNYFLCQLLFSYANAKPPQHDRAEYMFRSAIAKGLTTNQPTWTALSRAVRPQQWAKLSQEFLFPRGN